MEKYLVDLFAESIQERTNAPEWLVRLYLSLFSPPLGKTLRVGMVKELLRGHDLRGKRVLDVGCGIGDLSFLLADAGADVIGIELDPQKVACANRVARNWHFTRLRFVAGDVTRLDQTKLGQFDVICCIALLEHIQDDITLLLHLQSMLRPDGVFLLEVPSAHRKTIPEVEKADGHMRPGYIFEEVPGLLKKTGFKVISSKTMDSLGLIYHWCLWSRIVPNPQVQPWLFAALGPLFLPLIRLTSAFVKSPGSELCFLARKGVVLTPPVSRYDDMEVKQPAPVVARASRKRLG